MTERNRSESSLVNIRWEARYRQRYGERERTYIEMGKNKNKGRPV